MVWLLLLPTLLLYLLGSYCTYSQPVRESWLYTPAFFGISMATALLWVFAVKNLGGNNNILAFSMGCDILMVVAYYALPIIAQGNKLSWSAWAAAAVVIGGIFWFKMEVGE